MTVYEVIFTPGMDEDIDELETYIGSKSSEQVAESYVDKLVAECESLRSAPFRGTKRRDLRPNMRILGFKHAVSVLFRIEQKERLVVILGLSYRGRSIGRILDRHE